MQKESYAWASRIDYGLLGKSQHPIHTKTDMHAGSEAEIDARIGIDIHETLFV